jgi:hypothetical protein
MSIAMDLDLPGLAADGTVLDESLTTAAGLVDLEIGNLTAVGATQRKDL